MFSFFYYSFSFIAIFQLLNTTQNIVWPAVSMTLGNNTIWLANAAINVTTISYNITVRRKSFFFKFIWIFKNTTRPSFDLSYENNATTNASVTTLGYTRLFYYDIYTTANSVYTPMLLRITTNETYPGNNIPANVPIPGRALTYPFAHKRLVSV